MEQHLEHEQNPISSGTEEWVKPEIPSFLPAQAAEGIAYRPTDGISNLT